ncbi:MAG: S41 family peptidase [Bacteroidota bacterium]|nr:S41 family peptidase [Bacteroidota bacterium]
MKKLLYGLMFFIALTGCKGHEDNVVVSNSDVNSWVYDVMSELYYWNTSLPTLKTSNDNPTTYFETLRNKNDRFSHIFESYDEIANQLNGISSSDIGFDFRLYLENNLNNNVIGIVSYVKKGTPAAKAGIKRGSMFRKINNQQLTTDNYSSLINTFFDQSGSVNITFANIQNGIFVNQNPQAITKATNYQEDPVYLDTVYNVSNKKIGYLVYNFFANDPGDNSMKYDLELNSAFGKFKNQGISELILDLRYNSGGAMSSAINLASMIVPNLTSNKTFVYTEYNSNYTSYFNSSKFKEEYPNENPFMDYFATTINQTTVQNVGNNLQRVFVLTGQNTASASEMVINGLKPFTSVVLIGDTTIGKNVGSTLVNDDKNKNNKWAVMPIILKYFNANHQSDFTNGFAPDFYKYDYLDTQLGDTNEGLLATAISQITGVSKVAARSAVVPMTPFKNGADFKRFGGGLLYKKQKINGFIQ